MVALSGSGTSAGGFSLPAQQPKGMLFAQDYFLQSAVIVSSTGLTTDIRFILEELNIYETMVGDVVTGDVVLNDSLSHIMHLPLTGFEYLVVTFDKPQPYSNPIQRVFRIHKISKRGLVQDKNESYLVHFCSEEKILNHQYLVSKSYKGKLISDIVTDIYQNYLKVSGTRFDVSNIETTTGTKDYVVPYIRPFQTLNWLARRAQSHKYTGASYVSFENRDGFHFKTVEGLFDVGSVAQTYNFSIKNVQSLSDYRISDLPVDFVAVKEFRIDQNFDVFKNIVSGMYASNLKTFDPIRQTFTTNNFDYDSKYNDWKHVEPKQSTSWMAKIQNRLGDAANETPMSLVHFMPTRLGQTTESAYIKSHQKDIYPDDIEKWLPARKSQMASLNGLHLIITVPGDVARKVGEIIEFNLPSIEAETSSDRILDTYYSGRYLITGVRHKIDQYKYETILDITKDTTKTGIPAASGNAKVKNLVNM